MKTVAIVSIVGATLCACTVSTSTSSPPSQTPSNESTPTVEETLATPPPPAPKAIAPIRLVGSGKRPTKRFSIVGGVTEFALSYRGSSNFIVDLIDSSNGDMVENLANEIGTFTGTRILGVDAGRYLLQVDGEGTWSIVVTQPRPTSARGTPISFSGKHEAPAGPIELQAGLTTIDMRYRGQSNFIVDLLDSDGSSVDNLANEIGTWSGSQAEQIDTDGIYWLSVEADQGSWSISVH